MGIIDALKHDFVEAEQVLLGGHAAGSRERGHELEPASVVGGFKVLAKRLAPHGQPLFKHDRRLAPRERVPLQGVAGVGQLHPKPCVQLLHHLRRQGPEPVERVPLRIQ